VPELIAKSALEGQGPVTAGGVTLAELQVGPITSIAVLPGGAKALAKGLKPMGLTFPAQNSFAEKKGAAVTDQSDGWAVLSLSGLAAVEVLARLVPLDLRLAAFPVGRVARSGLNHMNAVILRTGDYAVEVMVFRSMARTAWHELETTMHMVAARSGVKI
jgi:heterotetrameric sarcosine oxidase gamma subunit